MQARAPDTGQGLPSPLGVAMVDALTLIPNVDLAIWRFGTATERVARSNQLKKARLMGGTATHSALEAALQWFRGHPVDHKVLVIFTDGRPDDAEEAARLCGMLRRSNVQILAGSLGMGLDLCARTLPGAVVFNVHPQDAESSLQVAIRRLGRRGP